MRGEARIRAQRNVGWGEKQGRRVFGGDAEVKMGEKARRGGAAIAQELAYTGLRRRPSVPENSRGKRGVIRKELGVD